MKLLLLVAGLAAAAATTTTRQCKLPKLSTDPFATARPEAVGLDSALLQKALDYGNTHFRISIQVFRHGCLAGSGLLNPVTQNIPNQVFSVTKSVVSILTGIAIDQGKLKLTDTVDKYLPTTPGWGDARHRNLTILQLLTETAGLRESILAETVTVGADPSAPQQALAQPFEHEAGTFFEYSQRVPDLLAYVVSRAVGRDLQAFAQQYLFGPLGIPSTEYLWLRDRAGNTYGYAWLFLSPKNLARLGHLALKNGKYRGQRIVSGRYLQAAQQGTRTNPCYGWLFWRNTGPCTGANIPDAQTYNRTPTPAAPADTFLMVGALHQNNFMIPSLDMLVTWSGTFGDTEPNLSALLSAAPADLYNNFFVLLMKAVKDAPVPAAGFLPADPLNLDINPLNYINPLVITSNLVTNPDCNVLFCNGAIPSQGALANLAAITNLFG